MPSLRWLLVPLALVACGGSGPSRPDFGAEEDISEPGEVLEGLRVEFTKPGGGTVDPVLTGVVEVGIRVRDDTPLPVSVVVEFPGVATFVPIQQNLSKPDAFVVQVDTRNVADGQKRKIRATATSEDGRTAVATLSVTVDNQGPKVDLLAPTPEDGADFLGELKIRAVAEDKGTGVTRIRVVVEDFAYEWPGGTPQVRAKLDTGDLPVDTDGWEAGEKALTIEAWDGVADHLTRMERRFHFVQKPSFQSGRFRPLPEGNSGTAIVPIRLGDPEEGRWGFVLAGNTGVALFRIDPDTSEVEHLASLAQSPCGPAGTADLDGDGREDVAAYCKTSGDQPAAVRVFLQKDDGSFAKPLAFPVPGDVTALALGELNEDGALDLVMALNAPTQNLGLILSNPSGGPGWSEVQTYAGAIQPTMVAIGQYLAGTNRNVIWTGRSSSPVVTVFPVASDGSVLAGTNYSLQYATKPLQQIEGAVAAAFKGNPGRPESLVLGDTGTDRIYLVKVLSQAGGQPTLNVASAWQTGVKPERFAIGDLTGDGVPEVVALCSTSRMLHVLKGAADGPSTTLQQVLAGPVQDLALLDFTGDGVLDAVLLDQAGTGVYLLTMDPARKRLTGAEMLLNPMTDVLALQAGRFTKALASPNQNLKDLAMLGPNPAGLPQVAVFAADATLRLPVATALPTLLTSVTGVTGMVAAQLDSTSDNTSLTDLVITTARAGGSGGERPATGEVLFLQADAQSHTAVATTQKAFDFGDSPNLVAVGDLDWSPSSTGTSLKDLAFVTSFWEGTPPEKRTRVQPYFYHLGTGDYLRKNLQGVPVEGPLVSPGRNPQQLVAFPLRRPLSYAVKSQPYYTDLITVNGGTGDFTVFPAQGGGFFFASSPERQKSFAVGSNPKALVAGYLRHPMDGSVPDEEAVQVFPDVVVMLDREVLVLFNTNTVLKDLSLSPELLSYEPPLPLHHSGSGPVDLDLADMNHDGYLDLVVLDGADRTVSVYVNLGSRSFSEPFVFPVGAGPSRMVVTDLDDNGCPDVVTLDREGRTLTFLRNLLTCR
ncbi:VCBS repeat-containing protein [Myxococcota bacterium]|nr:VCBS repeat-containing protein [Myxococcota bacterium]